MKNIKLKNVGGVYTGDLNNGITLVALVITIIILLILAGITISQLTGSGLFENAKLAKEKSENAQVEEDKILADYEKKISQEISNSREMVTVDKEEYEELKNTVKRLSEKITYLEENSAKFIDYNNLLTTITTQGASWIATEDCAIISELQVFDYYGAVVYVDGIAVQEICNQDATSSKFTSSIGVVYAKKGSVITTRENYGTYNIKIYGLQ